MTLINLMKTVTDLPVLAHAALSALTIGWFQWIKGKLDASYAASQHPVDYMTGQTTFDGDQVKGYYSAMIETDTLDVYVTTQLVDFGFILAFICIGLFICTLIARLGCVDSFAHKIGLFAGVAFVGGGLCDAVENGWSFIMLANPLDFANWLAIPYSLFATVKFGLITLGMVLAVACLLSAAIGRAVNKPQIG